MNELNFFFFFPFCSAINKNRASTQKNNEKTIKK